MAGISKRPADLIPAARDGDYLMIEEILKKYKSHVDYKSEGCTALQQASKSGRIEVMKLLIRNGADVDSYDADYSTPLHYAVDGNQPESVKLLLKSGANYHEKNAVGQTPPQLAFLRKLKDCNLVFLEYDPKVTFKPDVVIYDTSSEVSEDLEDLEDSAIDEETIKNPPEVELIDNMCHYCSKNTAIVTFKPCEHTYACAECATEEVCKCGEPIDSKALVDDQTVIDFIKTLQKAKWRYEEEISSLSTKLEQCSSQLEKARNVIICTICKTDPVDCMLGNCGHLFCEHCVWQFKRDHACPRPAPFWCPNRCPRSSRFIRIYPEWNINRKRHHWQDHPSNQSQH